MAGVVAGLTIVALTYLKDRIHENARIESIRLELKDFKKTSDDTHDIQIKRTLDGKPEIKRTSDGKPVFLIPEEIIRREKYKYMRKRIKPISDRLPPDKQLELNRALDFDYKKYMVIPEDLTSFEILEGEWPVGMLKDHSDDVFKKLEGLEWLKLNK